MPILMRWALGLEYSGTAYHGWQSQPSLVYLATVQGQVETAVTQIANHAVQVTCAGRTDRGVHALAQVIHFDTDAVRDVKAWLGGINRYLPADIRALWAQPVPENFHARYAATARKYRYIISNQPVRPAILRHQVTWFAPLLDIKPMSYAAHFLLGEHDFTAYRGADCQAKTAIRCLQQLDIRRCGEFICIDVQANAFLHHMVRNIVGVLLPIGLGKRQPIWAQQVLLAKDRSAAGVTAPPHGLYLNEVEYDDEWGLPKVKSRLLFLDE